MSLLKEIWKAQVESVLGQYVAGTTDYREVASVASHIGADYHGRFLVELIQNAEDQAGNIDNGSSSDFGSRLIIVRTESEIAILNEGNPFNDKGVRSVTSLGLSTKDPEHNLGNKGVGFKAVFEVSEAPEIYSIGKTGKSLWDEDATWFKLETKPFEDPGFLGEIDDLVRELLSRAPELETKLKEKARSEDAINVLRNELMQAAPFKFPKPVAESMVKERFRSLGLSETTLKRVATAVILPLLEGDKTRNAVDDAIDQLVQGDMPAAVLLFLNGINRLWIIDRLRGDTWLLRRQIVEKYADLEHHAKFHQVKTTKYCRSSGTSSRLCSEWWYARRQLGRNGDDPMLAAAEMEQIQAAVAQLEIANWKKVHSTHAAVALPRPQTIDPTPMGPTGLFCIGLPTHVSTGLPAWVDGPFHGKISRTEIDFESQKYNQLILNEAVRLFWAAIERLKTFPDVSIRREVTLSLEQREGGFSRAIDPNRSLSHRNVVLDATKSTFLKPADMAIPNETNLDEFFDIFNDDGVLSEFGFILPDRQLLIHARELLESLAGESQIYQDSSRYMAHSDSSLSMLEVTAKQRRDDGPGFWEPFLDWILAIFPISEIQDQAILPVGEGQLASPKDNVFFKPWVSADAEQSESQDAQADQDFADEIVEESDAQMMAGLHFFDETCTLVRQAGGRRFTVRAGRLSPSQGPVLVRSPRKVDLINLVLIPRLDQAIEETTDRETSLSILAQIADWMGGLEKSGRTRVEVEKFRVPVINQDGDWSWNYADNTYFGDGWLDANTDNLLSEAYGHRDCSRLPEWEVFKSYCRDDCVREDWVNRMQSLGVADGPRILTPVGPEQSYLKSFSRSKLTVLEENPCPIDRAAPFWETWLEYLSKRKAETTSGQNFVIRNPSWIDGLEDDRSRTAVIRLVLQNPQHYESELTVSVCRRSGKDSVSFPSLWIYTLRQQQWPVIPTNLGPRPPEEVWYLGDDEQQSSFVKERLVAHVIPPYTRAQRLLSTLGIHSPAEAPITRVISALQSAAAQLAEIQLSSRRPIRTLVKQLYGWLQDRCQQSTETANDLRAMFTAPIPLLKDDVLVPVDLNEPIVLVLEDDPERARHVAGHAEEYVLPLRSGKKVKTLINGLREILGDERVSLTSEMPLNVDFIPDVDQPDTSLLDFLENSFHEKGIDVVTDIGLLIAFGRTQQMDPRKDQFRDTWNRIRDVRLLRGKFRDLNGESAVYDARAVGGPALYVDRLCEPMDILVLSWRAVGPAHRDLWPAYVQALQAGSRETFFRDRSVSEAERDEVTSVIGYSRSLLIQRLQPVLFALLHRRDSNYSAQQFLEALELHAKSDDDLAGWLNIEETILTKLLNGIRGMSSDERIPELLHLINMSVAEWQRARRDLGMNAIRFPESCDGFSTSLEWILATLRTMVAHDDNTDSDMSDLDTILKQTANIECPESIATELRQSKSEIGNVLVALKAFLDNVTPSKEQGYLEKLIERLARQDALENKQLFGRDAPRREVELYRFEDESQRHLMATEALNSLLKVASALAGLQGESLDLEAIIGDPKITQWLNGPWANVFATLRTARRTVEPICPNTVKMLDAKQAFREPTSWRDLWNKFAELGPPELVKQTNETTVKRKLLGTEVIETDINNILAEGSAGQIGMALSGAVNADLNISGLATRDRPVVDPIPGRKKRNKKRRGGGHTVSSQEQEQTGLLGEAFVYEQFHVSLPGFDFTAWRSRNRTRYGLDAKGDDNLGYDFVYTDTEGKLTGRTDTPYCLIEVKATTGDAKGPFPMTDYEWYVAEECYKGERDETYVIVRVADVTESPRISDVLVDPVRLWQENRLSIANHDLLVRSGADDQEQDSNDDG